jgi:hypothetical protein
MDMLARGALVTDRLPNLCVSLLDLLVCLVYVCGIPLSWEFNTTGCRCLLENEEMWVWVSVLCGGDK